MVLPSRRSTSSAVNFDMLLPSRAAATRNRDSVASGRVIVTFFMAGFHRTIPYIVFSCFRVNPEGLVVELAFT